MNWAKIKLNNETHELIKSKYTFGRDEDCDFKFSNKLISSNHCFIEKDENGDSEGKFKAWLVDTSTNGCIINLTDKINKNKYLLSNNDKVYLAFKKDQADKNLFIEFEYNNELDKNNYEEDTVEPKNKKVKLDDEEKDVVEKKPLDRKIKDDDDDYGVQLTCIICSEIMHDCISLDCLHTFCAGCYSEWMEKSDECPICRLKVTRISKNHIVNNLIEAYLKHNPEKKRSDEEIKNLNEKNKIKQDMMYPTRKRIAKYKDDYEDESDEDEDIKKFNRDNNSPRGSIFASDNEADQDQEDDYNPIENFNNNNIFRPGFAYNFQPYNAGYQYLNQPHRFRCRQCPENKWFHQNDKTRAPDYTCTPYQNHILCQCCKEAMPDRSEHIRENPLLPKQTCSMCFKAYCNLYWECSNLACQVCLVKFGDLKPNNDILTSIINNNTYESQLFSDWLTRKQITIQQVLEECIEKVKFGQFKVGLSPADETLNKVVCRHCAYELFRELAYQYREIIPASDFFDHTNQRTNCYYGKNCRTQKHNLDHAKKFNHICEQSKLS